MIKCPNCKEEDYHIEDIIDTDMIDETVIHKCIAVCDHCDCRFIIHSFYEWDKDVFIEVID